MTSKFNIKFSIGDLVNYNGANSTWIKLNPWKVSSIDIVSGDTDIIYSLESGKEYTHLPQGLLEARTEEKKMTDVKPKFKVGDVVDFTGTDQDSVKCNPWTIIGLEIGKSGAASYQAQSKIKNAVGTFWEDFLTLYTKENKMANTNPATTKKIYLVYSKDRKAESEFNTLQAAENEARQLAEENIGEEFFVMESVAVASVRATYEKL